jgi:hypothetical protein
MLFVCMKWGTRYGSFYVNSLYNMIARNTSGPFQLVCFTDDVEGVRPEVDCRPLPDLPGVPEFFKMLPWRKISLWQRSLGADLDGRSALVLDLDIVITGPLDALFSYEPGQYVVIENWTKRGKNIGNTSVFRFDIGRYPQIYDQFVENYDDIYNNKFSIEQEYISDVVHRLGEQRFWPKTWIRSFKQELIPIWPLRLFMPVPLPPDARIIVFHGKPDPDEAMLGEWPDSPWREHQKKKLRIPAEYLRPFRKIYKSFRPVAWIGTHWQ